MFIITDQNEDFVAFEDSMDRATATVDLLQQEDQRAGVQNTYDVIYVEEPRDRIRKIRLSARLSQAAFCRKYGVPKRTLENWESGVNEPPAYVLDLFERVVAEDRVSQDQEQLNVDKRTSQK